MDRIKLQIDGMTCGHCVSAVDKALKGVNGVTVEQVGVGTATVSYDSAAIPAERITRAVEEQGYSVVAATN